MVITIFSCNDFIDSLDFSYPSWYCSAICVFRYILELNLVLIRYSVWFIWHFYTDFINIKVCDESGIYQIGICLHLWHVRSVVIYFAIGPVVKCKTIQRCCDCSIGIDWPLICVIAIRILEYMDFSLKRICIYSTLCYICTLVYEDCFILIRYSIGFFSVWSFSLLVCIKVCGEGCIF